MIAVVLDISPLHAYLLDPLLLSPRIRNVCRGAADRTPIIDGERLGVIELADVEPFYLVSPHEFELSRQRAGMDGPTDERRSVLRCEPSPSFSGSASIR
jgi:hypothetical protein